MHATYSLVLRKSDQLDTQSFQFGRPPGIPLLQLPGSVWSILDRSGMLLQTDSESLPSAVSPCAFSQRFTQAASWELQRPCAAANVGDGISSIAPITRANNFRGSLHFDLRGLAARTSGR